MSPFGQHGAVPHGSEIGCHFHVAVAQIGQTWMIATEATLDLLAQDVHRRRGTVVDPSLAFLPTRRPNSVAPSKRHRPV